MKWYLQGTPNLTFSDIEPKSMWKRTKYHSGYKKDLNMMTIMNLVRESRLHGVPEAKLWKTFLKHRWDHETTTIHGTKLADIIYKTGKELNLKYDWNEWIPEKDIRFGMELYSINHYCPEKLTEAAKLYSFFENLLSKENLPTVVAATMHNIQPRAGDNVKDFEAINM